MLQQLRFALRQLRLAPGFAAIAVLTLALGIGANTAIFSWVQAELLQGLPYAQPSRLLVLNETANGRTVSVPYPDYLDWRANPALAPTFSGMAWFQQQSFNLSGAGNPEQVSAADISGNFFDLLGVRMAAGRGFDATADQPATPALAVITTALARRQFGQPAAALGRTLQLDTRAYTVIGVLPSGFRDYNQTDIFVPAGIFYNDINDRGAHNDADVIARLAPGATASAAFDRMQAEMSVLARAYPADDAAETAVVRPIRALFVGNDGPMLWLLFGAVGLVLLIACVNVANLLLIRNAARRQEWAVRAALGASRSQLLRQQIIESLTLCLLGGGLGFALAAVAMPSLRTLATNATPTLSWPVLAFTALISILVALAFGMASAPRPALVRGLPHRRSWLPVAEVALALMLAVGAGLMLKSFAALTQVNPGFEPRNLFTFGLNLSGPRYDPDAPRLALEQSALARLAAVPGVTHAALGTDLPLTFNHSRADVTIAGQPLPAIGHFPHPDLHNISPGYFAAMGIPLLRGRDISLGDTATAPPVALVSAGFARQYWPHQDALGQHIYLGHPSPKSKLVTVVGVVGDTRQYGLDQPIRLEVYLSYLQHVPDSPRFVLRTALPPASLAPDATAIVRGLDASLPVLQPRTFERVMANAVANPRATLWLLAVFAGLALLLAAIGIYGVVSWATAQRTAEIGIRMALGADPGSIARLIGGDSLRLIALGLGLGLAGALLGGRLMASLLFGVSPADFEVYALATAVLLATGLAACALPIRRAARLAPWLALRRE